MPDQNLEFKVPPTDLQPATEKKKSFSGNIVVGMIFLVAVAAAIISGIYYWQVSKEANQAREFPIHKDLTATWKTYTNTQYGFEFKYPSDLYDNPDNTVLFAVRSTKLPLVLGGVKPETGIEGKDYISNNGFMITASRVDKKDIVIDLTKSVPDSYSSKRINIPGATAYETQDLGGVTCGPEVLISKLDSSDYYIDLAYCAYGVESNSVDKIFNQIVSTFKFTQ